jgi:uncharacterized protein YoxC
MSNARNSDQRLLFENFAQDLPPEHQAEFYRTLHEIGIGPEDRDLAKLFRALQMYKSFYEEIPAKVREALTHADKLTTRINGLRDDLAECLDKALAELKQNTEVASAISAHFHDTQSHLTAAVEKSAAEVSRSLEAELRKSLSAVLLKPFESCVAGIRDQCTLTASHAKQITAELRVARRIHIGAYGLAAVLISYCWASVAGSLRLGSTLGAKRSCFSRSIRIGRLCLSLPGREPSWRCDVILPIHRGSI